MTDPDVPAAALYLSGWLRGAPLHTETVAEAIAAARETHRRRGLGPDAGVLASFGEQSAAGLDADLWAWPGTPPSGGAKAGSPPTPTTATPPAATPTAGSR
ncbi:hypothetical protein [Streptacidiphilus sp. EB103A]|uniref:hypothetical protein n=1 Tax=Streptacidiphilus sp. EB103A TaxID=3156275 RepID=UPI0035111DB3